MRLNDVSPARRLRRFGRVALAAGLLTAGLALAPGPALASDEPEPEPAAPAAALRVMPLGDSITFGKGDPAENGYRADLYASLTQAGVPVDFVGSQRNGTGPETAHEGHPGWRIAQLTEHIDQWMADARPDVVLLDIGTNDLLHHDDLAQAPIRLRMLLEHIIAANPDGHILLAQLLVVDQGHAADFEAYNTAVAEVAALYPANVTLVSMAPIPVANTVDHVHPNQLGYQEMTYQWYEGLRSIMPTGSEWPAMADPFPADLPSEH